VCGGREPGLRDRRHAGRRLQPWIEGRGVAEGCLAITVIGGDSRAETMAEATRMNSTK